MQTRADGIPSLSGASGDHQVLDNRRSPCALGLIRAARAIRSLEPGAVLEIWTRDRVAPVEIGVWAEREGHQVIRQQRAGWWPTRYLVFEVRRAGCDDLSRPRRPDASATE